MIRITVMAPEEWDEKNEEFIKGKSWDLKLEHSLISISKWESKWHKSFIRTKKMTDEETIDYIKCMVLTPNVDPEVYQYINDEHVREIRAYIDNPMSATNILETTNGKRSNDVITSDLIYCWMVLLNIPFECQKWHLNRLITLITLCNIKSQSPNKNRMSKSEILSRNAAINARNRARFNSKG